MSKYEEYLQEIDQCTLPSDEALEAAADALTFVENLNTLLRENGADLPAEPDLDQIGNVLDGVFGELAAASIFLSEKVFARVPDMLRAVAKAFDEKDVDFTDPDGHVGPSVPAVVRDGYTALADRIESSRRQRAQILGHLEKFQEEQESS